ncbi:MAG: endonuclease V [Thermoplasmatota archaeon]
MSLHSLVKDFRENFYDLVEQIPEGKVTTYGDLAEALGDKRAARAVGRMLNKNPRPIEVPCHRVVRSDGSIGGYANGVDKKIELLGKEGLEVDNDNIKNFKQMRFNDFESEYPLHELRKKQLDDRDDIDPNNYINYNDETVIGGVDVSYEDDTAFSCLTLFKDGEKIGMITRKNEVKFPYISTYLSFREGPVLIDLIQSTDEKLDVLMVDGNGVMHPKGIGLASHIGVLLDLPTIGVAKSKLCGDQVNEIDQDNVQSRIELNGKLIGYALLSSDRAKKPIYVSSGHKVSVETAIKIVKDYCEYKIPEPIRKAHMIANKRRKNDE